MLHHETMENFARKKRKGKKINKIKITVIFKRNHNLENYIRKIFFMPKINFFFNYVNTRAMKMRLLKEED